MGGRREREGERGRTPLSRMLFVMRQRNDRGMKMLHSLGDRLTAVGKEVLIERADLRRANNVLRKHAVFYARFMLRHPSTTKARGYSFKPVF